MAELPAELPAELHEPLRAWAFNTALECSQDHDMTTALGGAVVDFRDLDRLLNWMVDAFLPEPPTTKGKDE